MAVLGRKRGALGLALLCRSLCGHALLIRNYLAQVLGLFIQLFVPVPQLVDLRGELVDPLAINTLACRFTGPCFPVRASSSRFGCASVDLSLQLDFADVGLSVQDQQNQILNQHDGRHPAMERTKASLASLCPSNDGSRLFTSSTTARSSSFNFSSIAAAVLP
jgi:hypothetical protein